MTGLNKSILMYFNQKSAGLEKADGPLSLGKTVSIHGTKS